MNSDLEWIGKKEIEENNNHISRFWKRRGKFEPGASRILSNTVTQLT
jgi:hypothetical protein